MEENGSFDRVFHSAEYFLHRDDRICARSVNLTDFEQDVFINISNDIDGCVVELKTLKAIKMTVRHIPICQRNSSSLVMTKSLLKKHINLTKYSKTQLSNFNKSVGFQLFYERGLECYIALIPSNDSHQRQEWSQEIIRTVSLQSFQQLKSNFRNNLHGYAVNKIATRTLKKNDLDDVSKIFILPDDTEAILKANQDAIDSTDYPYGFKPIVFCFRFGEKMLQGLSLNMFNLDEIMSATVHEGTDISSVYGIDLFWSMVGIQRLTGSRGVLSTCLLFKDCANFQSNLDGRLIDVKPQLFRLCRHPELLRFVQFYADVPHRNPKTRFHPVSGCIAGGMAFTKQTIDAFYKDAKRYISALRSNWTLMNESTCRLEVVVELQEIKDTIMPNDCIDINHIKRLLEIEPLLVPFPKSVIMKIQDVGMWLTQQLEKELTIDKKSGNLSAIWRSYQLELAEEKLLWGKPLTVRSNTYSVNLGPGVLETSRSLTDYLGFLALEESTACMENENTLPPTGIWTNSDLMKRRIAKTVGFHDILESSYCVIGRKLLQVLLQDLYDIGKLEKTFLTFGDYMYEMRNDSGRLEKYGAITTHRLVDI